MNSLFKPFSVLFKRTMQLIDKNYLKNKLKKRTGKCKKCSKCCGNCRHLNKQTKLCKIYNKRPIFFCYKEFPLDKSDQKLWNVTNCRYKFKK